MEDIRRHLQCPVCFEIPDGKIFQCYNSHNICESCCEKCNRCPQCSLPYGEIRLRNLLVEAIRDDLEENCRYLEQGCQETLKRKDLPVHLKNCNFRPIQMEKNENYNFVATTSIRSSSVRHLLRMTHEILRFGHVVKESEFRYTIHRSDVRSLMKKRERQNGYRVNDMTLFKLKSRNSNEPDNILVCQLTNYRYYSWLCLHMGASVSTQDAEEYKVQISISNTEDLQKNFECKWTTSVFSYKNVDKRLKLPPSPVSLIFLKGIPKDSKSCCDDLFVTLNIVRTPE